ncbi:MAG: hypothetical protein RIQ52_1701 [Pseudomonadota bacterium]
MEFATKIFAVVGIPLLYLLIGMIKPRWALLGFRSESRLLVSSIALILFMGSVTAYSKMYLTPKDPLDEQRRHREETSDFKLDRM